MMIVAPVELGEVAQGVGVAGLLGQADFEGSDRTGVVTHFGEDGTELEVGQWEEVEQADGFKGGFEGSLVPILPDQCPGQPGEGMRTVRIKGEGFPEVCFGGGPLPLAQEDPANLFGQAGRRATEGGGQMEAGHRGGGIPLFQKQVGSEAVSAGTGGGGGFEGSQDLLGFMRQLGVEQGLDEFQLIAAFFRTFGGQFPGVPRGSRVVPGLHEGADSVILKFPPGGITEGGGAGLRRFQITEGDELIEDGLFLRSCGIGSGP